MKIGAIIPTRGDRPEFLSQAMRLLERQTLRLVHVEVVNDPPVGIKKDITKRYRLGCERAFANGLDAVLFWEDDDYYDMDYARSMVEAWENSGKPQVFGISETIYYHLGIRNWNKQNHADRASAFCTLVSATPKWPNDEDPFTDIYVWKNTPSRKTIVFPKPMAIGIKGHQEGKLFGGIGHTAKMHGYNNPDPEMKWLQSNVDPESFEFYQSISKRVR